MLKGLVTLTEGPEQLEEGSKVYFTIFVYIKFKDRKNNMVIVSFRRLSYVPTFVHSGLHQQNHPA